MRKKFLVLLLFINTLFLYSFDKNKIQIIQYELDAKYQIDKEILENYGNLWAIYTLSEEIYINRYKRLPIKEISFYYKSNNDFIFLGKYNKNGIYNNFDELIFINPYSEKFIGYIENILIDPFYTGVYAYEQENRPGGFEPYAKIEIDFKNNSIRLK